MFNFEPSKPDQGYHCRCSFSYLPTNNKDFERIGFPMTLAVTPFPSIPESVPLFPYTRSESVRCIFCGAFVTKNSLVDPDGKGFTCHVCEKHNNFELRVGAQSIDQFQRDNSLFDIFNTKKKPVRPVKYNNPFCFFIIEHSKTLVDLGVFDELINQIISYAEENDRGKVGLIFYNNCISSPNVSSDDEQVRLEVSLDIENPVFPPIDHMIFNLKYQHDILIDFLNKMRKQQPKPVTFNLAKLIKSISYILNDECYDAVIVASELQQSTEKELQDIAVGDFQTSGIIHFLGLAMDTPTQFSAFNGFTGTLSGSLTVYGPEQALLLPREAILSFQSCRFVDASVTLAIPDTVYIEDIYGTGIRETDNCFIIPNFIEGTTIYFKIKPTRKFKYGKPMCVQARIPFHDCSYRFYIRVVDLYLPVSGDFYNVQNTMNYDVILASELNEVIEHNKTEGGSLQEALALKAKKVTSDHVKMAAVNSQVAIKRCWVHGGLRVAPFVCGTDGTQNIFGVRPDCVADYLAPTVWKVDIEGFTMGPYTLGGIVITEGALLMKLTIHRAALYLADSEDPTVWRKELANVEGGLTRTIAEHAPGSVIEVISRQEGTRHPTLKHIERLIALLPVQK